MKTTINYQCVVMLCSVTDYDQSLMIKSFSNADNEIIEAFCESDEFGDMPISNCI